MRTMIDLTECFPMRFDLERMRKELQTLERSKWIGHYDKALSAGWTAVPLVSRDGTMDSQESQRVGKCGQCKRTPIVDALPYFRQILDTFQCPQGRIRILRIMPGASIGAHRDILDEVACFAFGQVRLHIPIVTNEKVVFVVGGERLQLLPGRLYYINFAKVHYVRNEGDEPRTHLVMDVQVNDWLRSIFPPLTLVECLENIVVRHTWPIWWLLLQASWAASRYFWTKYEGSALQRFRHKLRHSLAHSTSGRH